MLTIYAIKQIKNQGYLLELRLYESRKKENCHELIF